jgi:hypothetical protein
MRRRSASCAGTSRHYGHPRAFRHPVAHLLLQVQYEADLADDRRPLHHLAVDEFALDVASAEPPEARIATGTAVVGMIGLGYVGVPLVFAYARRGLPVRGLDVRHIAQAAEQVARPAVTSRRRDGQPLHLRQTLRQRQWGRQGARGPAFGLQQPGLLEPADPVLHRELVRRHRY